LSEGKTATSWDSYKETLKKVMELVKPEEILEYGPGESSKIMLGYEFVKRIDAIEHDENYYNKWHNEIEDPRFYQHYKSTPEVYVNGFAKPYDLVFIDGRDRERCIARALNRVEDIGIVIVHDAERPRYKEAMDLFDYIIFTDNGSTATLTNDQTLNKKLSKALDGL
jgi:predicted O-methyltransferase YrrM